MKIREVGAAPWLAGLVRVALGVCAWSLCPSPASAWGAATARASGPPTFARDVARILQEHCQVCHRPGKSGPFPLQTYEQARKRASDLVRVADEGRMPPWLPAREVGPELKHDRSLPPEALAVLRAWAEAGAPRGDPAEMPPPRRFPEDWTLGAPDVVLEPSESFTVPASGPDIYRCFVIPTDLPADVSISAVEYRPGNDRVVHHTMAFIDTSGEARKRDEADPGPGYTSFAGPGVAVYGDLGGWAAGNEASHLPEGVGRDLPRKADIVLQVHYHPSGKPEVDRTRLGIYLSRAPIRQTLQWAHATNSSFKLPAGRPEIKVCASWYVPVDVEAHAITPHMHQLARDFRMSVVSPDGRSRDLLFIPSWDPSWQNTYYFREPIPLAKGSVVKVVVHYDNSAHARNPHRPPKLVTWGPEVTDEMCVGYIGVTKKGQDLTRPGEKDDLFALLARQQQKNYRRARELRRRR